MRLVAMIVGAGAVLLTSVWPASAQAIWPQYGNMNSNMNTMYGPTGFPNQSALSPWLNMLRGGNPAANYFLGVLPEYDRRYFQSGVNAALPGLESSIAGGQQPLDITAIPMLNQTGHLSAFQAYGMYYNMPGQQRPYYPLNPNQARMLPR